MRLPVIAVMLALSGVPAAADEVRTLGFGRLFTNDVLGDGEDRWRTGAYLFSVIRGAAWEGERPGAFGRLLEYRLRAEIIAPARVVAGVPDRPYAGSLSAGLHSHSALGPLDLSLGADLTLIGPQTGLGRFQDWYHDLFSLPGPLGLGSQLGDAVRLSATAELAWPLRLSSAATLRPFLELQTGVEDLFRVGADVILGPVGQQDLLVRDPATGTPLRAVEGGTAGLAFIGGADWARVADSALLPGASGAVARDERVRLRAGLHWQVAPGRSLFYGVTWLSEEFEAQPEGQLLGGVKLDFNF